MYKKKPAKAVRVKDTPSSAQKFTPVSVPVSGGSEEPKHPFDAAITRRANKDVELVDGLPAQKKSGSKKQLANIKKANLQDYMTPDGRFGSISDAEKFPEAAKAFKKYSRLDKSGE